MIIDYGKFNPPTSEKMRAGVVAMLNPVTIPPNSTVSFDIKGNWTVSGALLVPQDSTLRVVEGSILFSGTTNVIGSLQVEGGAKLTFPNVTNYTQPAGQTVSWTSHNVGTEVNFPNLTSIIGNGSTSRRLTITAQFGGVFNLPALATVSTPGDPDNFASSGITLSSNNGNNGVFSSLNLPLLTSYQDLSAVPDSWIQALNGAAVNVPNLRLSGLRGIRLTGLILQP